VKDLKSIVLDVLARHAAGTRFAEQIATEVMENLTAHPEALLIAGFDALPLRGHGSVSVSGYGAAASIYCAVDSPDDSTTLAEQVTIKLKLPTPAQRSDKHGNTWLESSSDDGDTRCTLMANYRPAQKVA
jgi:hypothetical protein